MWFVARRWDDSGDDDDDEEQEDFTPSVMRTELTNDELWHSLTIEDVGPRCGAPRLRASWIRHELSREHDIFSAVKGSRSMSAKSLSEIILKRPGTPPKPVDPQSEKNQL